jgi:hypothetical protein
MGTRSILNSIAVVGLSAMVAATATAATIPFFFSTGNPDGKIGTLSRPASPGLLETETADDFITTLPTTINSATFVGLLPLGAPLSSVNDVEIELYHVFPVDSASPPSGNVPTRVNSPSDHEFAAFDSAAGDVAVTTTLLNSSFAVANTLVNGIHANPNQFTGGEGPATGEEVLFNITFNTPFTLSPDHYFFRPEVGLTSENFLWLSAPRPIVAPGTPFSPDLQSWTRNGNLAPDWLRIGTDITGQGPFDATFSLTGTEITPEPSTWLLLGTSLLLLGSYGTKRRSSQRK